MPRADDWNSNWRCTPWKLSLYVKPMPYFQESRGLGWMLEVNDDDDSQLPLLWVVFCIFSELTFFREELDIDITDIYYKIRCILLPLPYFRMKLNLVRESPDFWGPLVVVLSFAVLSLYGQLSVGSFHVTIINFLYRLFLGFSLCGSVAVSWFSLSLVPSEETFSMPR